MVLAVEGCPLHASGNWTWRYHVCLLSCTGKQRAEAFLAASGAWRGAHLPCAPASPSLPMAPRADPALVNQALPPAREPVPLRLQPLGHGHDTTSNTRTEDGQKQSGASAQRGIGSKSAARIYDARVPGARPLRLEDTDTRSDAAQLRNFSLARLDLADSSPAAASSAVRGGSSSGGWAPMHTSRRTAARAVGPGEILSTLLRCFCGLPCCVSGMQAPVAMLVMGLWPFCCVTGMQAPVAIVWWILHERAVCGGQASCARLPLQQIQRLRRQSSPVQRSTMLGQRMPPPRQQSPRTQPLRSPPVPVRRMTMTGQNHDGDTCISSSLPDQDLLMLHAPLPE